MTTIKFEIKQQIAALSASQKGWRKELNLISWNGYAPKYDIREWDPTHTKMGKGVTLTDPELKELYATLKGLFEESVEEKPSINVEKELGRWNSTAPLFYDEMKNVVAYMNEMQLTDEEKKSLFIGTNNGHAEVALKNEIESLSSIYTMLYREFVDLLKALNEEQLELLFLLVGN